MIKYILLICMLTINLVAETQFSLLKEDGIELYYEKSLNPYTVEYALKLVKHSKNEFAKTFKFKITNTISFKIYLYADTINFISDQKGMWWESYIFKTNFVYINNVDFLMEKNSFNLIIKYLITYRYLLVNFKEKIPAWFLKGVALYFANLTFPASDIKFTDFKELLDKLDNYATKEEFYQANRHLYNGIDYLASNYTFDKIVKFIKNCNTTQDFEKLFFQFFGLHINEFKEIILK